jgi:hypothetical protein
MDLGGNSTTQEIGNALVREILSSEQWT